MPIPHGLLAADPSPGLPGAAGADEVDVLVVGSGVAGLSAALAVPAGRTVLLATKDRLGHSATRYAQRGIAAVLDPWGFGGLMERSGSPPMDPVSDSVAARMAATGARHLWLDATSIPAEHLERRFPTILGRCRAAGIEPTRRPIPVSPAAHYLMGGVLTDLDGRTSLPGLFAVGEAACTGVHGANRLASNSLLEGVVFAARIGRPWRRAGGMRVHGRWAPGLWTVRRPLPAGRLPSRVGARRRRVEWSRAPSGSRRGRGPGRAG